MPSELAIALAKEINHFLDRSEDLDADVAAIIDEHLKPLVEALETYASCSHGCNCGDGWGHGAANSALQKARQKP